MTCCYAHGLLVVIGMRLGEHKLTRFHAEQGLAVARHLGAPSLEVIFRCRLAHVELVAGAWEESLRHGTEAVSLARRMRHARNLAFALAGRAMTLTLLGDLSEAAGCISELRQACGSVGTTDRYVNGLADMAETTLALERGQVERALAIPMDFVASSESIYPAGKPCAKGIGLIPPYMPMGLMLLAEAQAVMGEPERALETARRLRDLGPVGNRYLEALASRSEGLARKALGDRDVAIVRLGEAAELFVELEMPFEAARAGLDLATAALNGTAGQREQATATAQQSLGTFERLGAQRYAKRTRQLLRGLGEVILATRHPRLAGVAVSERELEIARLVTEGMTTPEIARRLILSPRTISRHLERLYARLGIGTRTALARCVIEAGLAQLKK
ncbi:MAG: LuxR C-terminal-related transcriptional regulator [Dehalococcoidia bacterium]|nr:LuxR C-terminal-related transcriptional regulator [Dehalococcoidia bacterium]